MKKKLIIITGGSRGIGKELVKSYTSLGKNTLHISMMQSPEFSNHSHSGEIHFLETNLSETKQALFNLTQWLNEHPEYEIECVIHNAVSLNLGRTIGFGKTKGKKSTDLQTIEFEKFIDSYAVNVITPIMMTASLRKNNAFVKGDPVPVIYLTSSAARDADDTHFPGLDLYSATKAALNKHVSLQRLEFFEDPEYQVRTIRVYPGIVDTELQNELRSDSDGHLGGEFVKNISSVPYYLPKNDWLHSNAPGHDKRTISAGESARFILWVSKSMRTDAYKRMTDEVDYYLCKEYHQFRNKNEQVIAER